MTQHKAPAQAARQPRRFNRAFTLVELIVAIGAIALVAVGIAAIFESIGRTVAGGRRVNQLNEYAALIERQMRSDFESMTRDGVLVIKHDFADADGDGVIDLNPTNSPDRVLNSPLQRADEARLRRIDQLLFFARGDFTSARAPMVPGLNASSNEAMIYYGHGMKLDPLLDPPNRTLGGGRVEYRRPQLNDGYRSAPGPDGKPGRAFPEERALGFTESSYTTNPNRYAENWSLLRQVTLLAQPNSSDLDLPEPNDPFWTQQLRLDRVTALDSDIQLGGQPAATSVFSHLAATFPLDYSAPYIRAYRGGDQNRAPSRASGLVDAATTDLAEIRRIIMDAGQFPWVVAGNTFYFDPTDPNYILDDQYQADLNLSNPVNNLLHMHAWMEDLFPVITDRRSPLANPVGVRARYEESLPDYVGTLSTYTDARTRKYPFIQKFRLTDQRMLSNAVFVPRCTEFIVEYSFGETVTDDTSPFYGQLVWHGLARSLQNTGNSGFAAQPYPYWNDPVTGDPYAFPHNQSYVKLDGSIGTRTLPQALLYGRSANQNQVLNYESLTAYFGYNDPTYTPANPDVDPTTLPWAWPKLVRITMTLADPVDPSIEQTFQFVFETPEGRAF